jgi:hypothetical protein
MKRLQIISLIISSAFSVQGQSVATESKTDEEVDTAQTHNLKEIVVESKRMNMTVNKISYTPSKRQRNSSANGAMLLHQLAIPQLKVDVLSGDVKTSGGAEVSFFIDGVPATSNDVAAINTRDVMRVEVMDYPDDPRFRNAAHVVNYVMQKYEYGGYTKLSNADMLLSCLSTENTVNSKLVYKKMMYDIRASHQYTNGKHNGSNETQIYNLPGYADDGATSITRTSMVESSKNIVNRASASFRALYQDTKIEYSSQLDWAFDGARTKNQTGSLMYTPSIFSADSWDICNPTRKNSVNWSNDLYKPLPCQWTLSAMFNVSYDHTNQTQYMQEGDVNIRDLTAKEDVWSTQAMVDLSKKIGGNQTFSFNMVSKTYKSDIDYLSAEKDYNHVTQLTLAPGVAYSYRPNEKLYALLRLFATYYHSSTSAITEKKVFPSAELHMSWMPHQRHRFGIDAGYVIKTPSGSQTNSVLLQTDQLQWTQGNPNLKSYHDTSLQINYTWSPSQYINVSPIATWIYRRNYFADTYSLMDGGRGILVKPENCGNYNNLWATVNFSAYALNRKLVLSVSPTISYHKFTGFYDINQTGASATVSGVYYLGSFYVGASYASAEKFYNQADAIKRETRSQYWLMAGWGNSSWTVYGVLVNPFRSHWLSNITSIETQDYAMRTTAVGLRDHRRINLSVVYTFGYGKKVNRNNDLQSASTTDSSIR